MKTTCLVFFLFIILIISFSNVSAIVINEVMYDPPSNLGGAYNEWIELYNPTNESINLTGWKISDMNFNLSTEYNHSITFINQTNISDNGYFILARNPPNFSYYWDVSCPIAKFNTSGLNNDQEIVRIYSVNGSLIDEVYYDNSIGADGDGKSLQLCNGSLLANSPTPGALNNCSQGSEPPPQQQESSIEITDAPDRADFGDDIDVELEIYRGNTSKYAVYIYVEDDDGKDVSSKETLHCDEKFTNYTEQITLTLDCENKSDKYVIVAEGLNERAEQEIDLNACYETQEENKTEEESMEGTTIGDFTYALTIPNTIYIDQEFPVQIKITSQSEQEQEFLVWSYIYIGSKCYSCSAEETRESNAKSIVVPSGSSSDVELKNIVPGESGAGQGEYKLKIKVLQEGLKTPKEFTYNITLEANNNVIQPATQTQQSSQQIPSVSAYSTYSSNEIESESFSLVKIMPYVLTSVALLAAIYLIITKI